MDEFSLYILDITMNSVRAGASQIGITLREDGDWLWFTVTDNGCGMTRTQVEKLKNPFFTTRKTRKVGLGVPFLAMLAEMTGGSVEITSVPAIREDTGEPDPHHGTTLTARFGRHHIDFLPMGSLPDTIVTLIQGSPETDFTFTHERDNGPTVRLSCHALKAVLGDEISLAEPEILQWIRGYLQEQYEDDGTGNVEK